MNSAAQNLTHREAFTSLSFTHTSKRVCSSSGFWGNLLLGPTCQVNQFVYQAWALFLRYQLVIRKSHEAIDKLCQERGMYWCNYAELCVMGQWPCIDSANMYPWTFLKLITEAPLSFYPEIMLSLPDLGDLLVLTNNWMFWLHNHLMSCSQTLFLLGPNIMLKMLFCYRCHDIFFSYSSCFFFFY